MVEKLLCKGIMKDIKLLYKKIFKTFGLISIIGVVVSCLLILIGEPDMLDVIFILDLIIIAFAGLIILGILTFFNFWMSKCSITVTDRRVYGRAAFNNNVDLPIDSISAVGTSSFKGIDVATSSGEIHFKLVENSDEIHKAISNLLVERQNTSKFGNSNPESNSADALKKFKDLLDAGVITQEEFDLKKKQLLGL